MKYIIVFLIYCSSTIYSQDFNRIFLQANDAYNNGLYEEANKSYYIGYSPDRALKTNIAYILHQADSMATHIEHDMWKRGYTVKVEEKKEVVEKKTEQSKKANQAFKELFGIIG